MEKFFDMKPPIMGFTGEYRFLSNFYPATVNFNGHWFPTVEHAYQAAKVRDDAWNEEKDKSYLALFSELCSPGAAKTSGKRLKAELLRPNWDSHKVSIMEMLLQQKFNPVRSDLNLYSRLKATEGRQLVELNTWGDKFWGVVRVNGNMVGKNRLGYLLMGIRDRAIDSYF